MRNGQCSFKHIFRTVMSRLYSCPYSLGERLGGTNPWMLRRLLQSRALARRSVLYEHLVFFFSSSDEHVHDQLIMWHVHTVHRSIDVVKLQTKIHT